MHLIPATLHLSRTALGGKWAGTDDPVTGKRAPRGQHELTQPGGGGTGVPSAVTMMLQCRASLVPRDVFQGPRGMWMDGFQLKLFFHLPFICSLVQYRYRALPTPRDSAG